MDVRCASVHVTFHPLSMRFSARTAPGQLPSALRRARSVLLMTIGACGGGTGDTPSGPSIQSGKPGLTLSGAVNVTDTINARLAQPLTVVLRDTLGQPVALKPVRFTVLFNSFGQPLAAIQNPDNGTNVTFLTLLTGPDGRIAAYLSLGSIIGASGVVVQTVDAPIYKDTVRFTVL